MSQSNSYAQSAKKAEPAGRRGLTIIELIIAAAIVAVLSAVAVPQYLGYVQRTEVKQAVADIRTLEMSIGTYRTEMSVLPNNIANIVDPLPSDPWGNPYQYANLQSGDKKIKARKDKNLHPLNSDYDLYSKGTDGDTKIPLTAKASRDDVLRANDGAFVGLAEDY